MTNVDKLLEIARAAESYTGYEVDYEYTEFQNTFTPRLVEKLLAEIKAVREVEALCGHSDAKLELDLDPDMKCYWCTCERWVTRQMLADVECIDKARKALDHEISKGAV